MKKTFACLVLLISLSRAFAQNPEYPPSITVAQDGSGNYKTIQEAINAVRDLAHQRVTIHIKKGIYQEKVVVPSWKTNITLLGESKDSTIITGNDYSGKPFPGGKDRVGGDKYSTYTSYTLLVEGNDFIARNLTIQNTAGRVGQAVALHVEADRVTISNCRIVGNQDTLYAGKENSRQYYQDCYIEGTTDFIFGEATAVFKNCTIKNLVNSYLTAASTRQRQQYGYVFIDCRLIADTAARKVWLGRPWRPYAKTVFIHCEMGNHIIPAGWDPWKGDSMFPDKEKTALYAEYKSKGLGANPTARVKWSRQLSAKEARQYTVRNILSGQDHWDPLTSQ